MNGYYGIGIVNGKTPANIGLLWRSAHVFGAAFLFTVGHRYQRQPTDTTDAARHVPLYVYSSVEDLIARLPHGCQLVGVECLSEAAELAAFEHPPRACYVLGAEDSGLPRAILDHCHAVIRIPGRWSLNVAVAGSIVLSHRVMQRMKGESPSQRPQERST